MSVMNRFNLLFISKITIFRKKCSAKFAISKLFQIWHDPQFFTWNGKDTFLEYFINTTYAIFYWVVSLKTRNDPCLSTLETLWSSALIYDHSFQFYLFLVRFHHSPLLYNNCTLLFIIIWWQSRKADSGNHKYLSLALRQYKESCYYNYQRYLPISIPKFQYLMVWKSLALSITKKCVH